MIGVFPNLFVGTQQDYELNVKSQPGWMVVHACKEPYHRQELGYTSQGAPKNHPEYLIARRGNRLILNLVDAPDPRYIPKEIIDANPAHPALGCFISQLIRINFRRILLWPNRLLEIFTPCITQRPG